MNLNNAMRKELAVKLAAQAMSKHSAGLGRLAGLVSRDFRLHHEQLLQALVPEIPIYRWPELIQQRIVNSASSGSVRFLRQGADGVVASGQIRGGPLTDPLTDAQQTTLQALLSHLRNQHPGFRDALQLFSSYPLTCERGGYLEMVLYAVPDLPHVPGRKTLDLAEPGQALLLKNCNALIARLSKILTQGFEYLEEVQLLLAGIRTDKQLQELFPEAVKLLPPPPAPRSNIVPVELAQRVRKMLVDGVPED